jgi:hypothetical protein
MLPEGPFSILGFHKRADPNFMIVKKKFFYVFMVAAFI